MSSAVQALCRDREAAGSLCAVRGKGRGSIRCGECCCATAVATVCCGFKGRSRFISSARSFSAHQLFKLRLMAAQAMLIN